MSDRTRSRFLLLACLAPLSPSQDIPLPPPDPLALVAQAETLCAADEAEGTILLLWRALAEFHRIDPDPKRRSATRTAKRLLSEHDPNHEARLQTNALVAKAQATLAAMYRRKKWYDTGARRLDMAEQFDRAASRKERIAFDKVRSRIPTAPATTAKGKAKKLNELFDRGNTVHVDGPWRLVDNEFLESGAHDGSNVLSSWLSKTTHEDGEIVLELHPTDPRVDRNAGLIFGAVDRHNYYCARFGAFVKNKFDSIEIYVVKNDVEKRLAGVSERNRGRVDASHRLVLHIRGSHLRFQVDNRQPVEVDTGAPVRGRLGLCVGVTGYESCPVQFRRFDIGPLPGDQLTAEELGVDQETKARNNVMAMVDLAKAEVAQKKLEVAAARLRQARYQLRSLTADAQRVDLAQSIDALIKKSDRQHKKCATAEQQCAELLVALADKYAASGMPRAAFEIVAAAARFAPMDLVDRESRAQRDVDAWRATQTTKPTEEPQPSVEGGAALRAWFTEGRRLYNRSTIGWVVEGPTARVESLQKGQIAALMPRRGLPPLSSAAIAVRLPSIGAAAGFCFDVAGSHDFAVARLERTDIGLVLSAQRWRGKKWTQLGSEVIERPASACGGWFDVEIQATDKGLVARAAGKTVTVAMDLLGAAAGRYGLVATNSGRPATIEVAAFRFSK